MTNSILNTSRNLSLQPAILIQDPLEQFEVTRILSLCSLTLINNIGLTWIAIVVCLSATFFAYSINLASNYDYATQGFYQLIVSIVRENLYIRKQQYSTAIFYLFRTLLVANLIGLVPFAFTVTSSFIVTLFLALTHFVGVNLVGATRYRWELNNLFLPTGAPLAIAPFLILIETVSYFARVLSLSIRLFANRRSGHALLKILIGFSLSRGASTSILLNVIAIFPWSVVTAVRFLELLIAFLQAYVFTILVSLYVNDNLNLH